MRLLKKWARNVDTPWSFSSLDLDKHLSDYNTYYYAAYDAQGQEADDWDTAAYHSLQVVREYNEDGSVAVLEEITSLRTKPQNPVLFEKLDEHTIVAILPDEMKFVVIDIDEDRIIKEYDIIANAIEA